VSKKTLTIDSVQEVILRRALESELNQLGDYSGYDSPEERDEQEAALEDLFRQLGPSSDPLDIKPVFKSRSSGG
jgi:hypothetical protein